MTTPDSKKCLSEALHLYKNSSVNNLHGPSSVTIDCVKKLDLSSEQIAIYNKTNFLTEPYISKLENAKICIPQKEIYLQPIKTYDANSAKKFTKPLKKREEKTASPMPMSPKCYDEPGVFITPAPFPPKPLPVLTVPDQGDPCPDANRCETILDKKEIVCFDIGGEKRLCNPQIFNIVLDEFSLQQIEAVIQDLLIYCSQVTPKQLDILKAYRYLPDSANTCGLMTKTDAQRLTHILKYQYNAPRVKSSPKELDSLLKVSHNCFGKCKGAIWLDFYKSIDDPCIQCLECNLLFSPEHFVCHVHRQLEKKTVHWGFESQNWRSYLMLSKDQTIDLHKAEQLLEIFKAKFDSNNTANHKRKQTIDVKGDITKKVRGDHLQYAYDDQISASYMWNSCHSLLHWPATPILTRDGKPLPPPPAAFVRDSAPAPIPSYLSQGPPVLVDPARVVPLSESQKFERHYQPNVALAPPKVRDKMAREAAATASANSTSCNNQLPSNDMVQHLKQKPMRREEPVEEIVVVKLEDGLPQSPGQPLIIFPTNHDRQPTQASPKVLSPVSHRRIGQVAHQDGQAATPAHQVSYIRSASGPNTPPVGYHPDLELSTTDSDTESAVSVTSKNEVVEQVENLLSRFEDRASATKILQIVDDLVNRLNTANKQCMKESSEKAKLEYKLFRQTRQLSNSNIDLASIKRSNSPAVQHVDIKEKNITETKIKTEPKENGNC